MPRLPNFLYIGTSKAGSTWLYDVLNHHPDVYMAPGKGLYFFSYHYERGFDWYASHFAGARGERVVGEVSHTYLYAPAACERIAAMDPETRLMVCLRDPTDRAFSQYLDLVKNEHATGSFEDQLAKTPELVEWGRYAKYLRPYVARFGVDRIHVGVFEELEADPEKFARKVLEFLEVEPMPLSARQRTRIMPAGAPRSRGLMRVAKRASRALRAAGMRRLHGEMKTSRRVRGLLYRPYAPEERPVMCPETRERLRALFGPEAEKLDALLGTRFCETWGYR